MSKTVLVVAAHSDDEVLGCGGTIAKHVSRGDNVHLIFLTDGTGARNSDESEAKARVSASERAAEIMGASSITQLSFPDNQIDNVPLLELIKATENASKRLSPEIVYTHHSGDLNIDHRLCSQAVLTLFRPMPGTSVTSIYAFEVASSTEWAFGFEQPFQPQYFVDISDTLDIKLRALEAYADEMREFPHSRSIEAVTALAKWRGASVGCSAAEAFSVFRIIS